MTPTELADLHLAAVGPDDAWQTADFEAHLGRPPALLTHLHGAFCLGRVVADEAEVLMLATHPVARRKGLAREVLAAFCDRAQNRGSDRVFLEVSAENTPARSLYAQAGFVEVARRRGYYQTRSGAQDAIVLQRDLTQG